MAEVAGIFRMLLLTIDLHASSLRVSFEGRSNFLAFGFKFSVCCCENDLRNEEALVSPKNWIFSSNLKVAVMSLKICSQCITEIKTPTFLRRMHSISRKLKWINTIFLLYCVNRILGQAKTTFMLCILYVAGRTKAKWKDTA